MLKVKVYYNITIDKLNYDKWIEIDEKEKHLSC